MEDSGKQLDAPEASVIDPQLKARILAEIEHARIVTEALLAQDLEASAGHKAIYEVRIRQLNDLAKDCKDQL